MHRQVRLRIYAALPTIGCKGLCAHSCGPVAVAAIERRVIEERSGLPLDINGEGAAEGMLCNHLARGRCTVYSDRPLLCRLWGVAEGMECPHGCKVSRVLDRYESAELLEQLAVLGGGFTFGPRTEVVYEAIQAALPVRPLALPGRRT